MLNFFKRKGDPFSIWLDLQLRMAEGNRHRLRGR